MKVMFFGDIVGRSGRDGLAKHLPALKSRYAPDVMIANAENIAGGHGITMKLAAELFELGIDCLTSGNHVWGQRELLTGIIKEPRILRPHNYPEGTPGRGTYTHILPDGRRILIINLMARVFMEPVLDDPFAAMEKIATSNKLPGKMPILVDFHGETTSEKGAFAAAFDGRVSAVVGTHTHAPTADERVLPKGTAYMSDVGMCGDYDSVIGMKKETAIWRFTRKTPIDRLAPAEGEATICGVLLTFDDTTGLSRSIEAIRTGGILKPT